MKKGKLYGVGVGSGDKELITLKALKALKKADIIAVPRTKSGERTAYGIVEEFISDKEIINFTMPMSKDFEKLQKNYEIIADKLSEYLNMGKNTAFITLGDPTIYSTYMQINDIMLKRGYETELIAGVTSFCAAACRLNISLCERDEPLIVLPASYEDVRKGIGLKGTKVLMKAGSSAAKVMDILKEEGLAENSAMVERCGMENEKIYKNIDEINDDTSYFNVIIVKDKR